MTELLVAIGLIAGVIGAHEMGFWLSSLTHSADEPLASKGRMKVAHGAYLLEERGDFKHG